MRLSNPVCRFGLILFACFGIPAMGPNFLWLMWPVGIAYAALEVIAIYREPL